MATLNHLNLTTYNVPALAALFRDVFGFTPKDVRNDKFAIMTNGDNFVLAIMHDKNMSPEHGYPGYFHVGFLQPDTAAVDRMHSAFIDYFYAAPQPQKLIRGGPPTYGFYFNAPGGVQIEVSTMNL